MSPLTTIAGIFLAIRRMDPLDDLRPELSGCKPIIGDDHIELRRLVVQRDERLIATFRGDHAPTPLPEQPGERLERIAIVVYHQRQRAVEAHWPGRRRSLRDRRSRDARCQRHLDREQRSAPFDRADVDFELEQLREALDYRESQTQTFGSVGQRRARLVELIEDAPELARRNADAGIPYLDSRPLPAAATSEEHTAFARVPHCVGYEVADDPFEKQRVRHHSQHRRAHAKSQALRLCGAREAMLETVEQTSGC